MSKIRCFATVSAMDDSAGYQLKTLEIKDFQNLYDFLNQSELRSKIQKISLQDESDPDRSISIVVESLVKK